LQEFCLLALSQPRPQASEDGSIIMARRSLSPRLQVFPMDTVLLAFGVLYAAMCMLVQQLCSCCSSQ
jgi:hypothetical protein